MYNILKIRHSDHTQLLEWTLSTSNRQQRKAAGGLALVVSAVKAVASAMLYIARGQSLGSEWKSVRQRINDSVNAVRAGRDEVIDKRPK